MSGDEEFCELFFDQVRLPTDRIIGAPGQGWAIALEIVGNERGPVAWQRQAWLRQRFDALRSLPAAVNHRDALCEVAELLYAVRLSSRETVRTLDRGEQPGPEGSVDKLLLARAEQQLYDTALQIDPSLLLADHPEARRWRAEWFFSRAASIYGGSSEIQRSIVANRILALPRSA
jgi:alkylation response protein AidB-like acyl-CoA dehydrogenase